MPISSPNTEFLTVPFAAVRPSTGQGFALVLPEATTGTMQAFLDRFAATPAADEHAVMLLDQAGWHGAHDLVVPENVTLVPLPPYSYKGSTARKGRGADTPGVHWRAWTPRRTLAAGAFFSTHSATSRGRPSRTATRRARARHPPRPGVAHHRRDHRKEGAQD